MQTSKKETCWHQYAIIREIKKLEDWEVLWAWNIVSFNSDKIYKILSYSSNHEIFLKETKLFRWSIDISVWTVNCTIENGKRVFEILDLNPILPAYIVINQ